MEQLSIIVIIFFIIMFIIGEILIIKNDFLIKTYIDENGKVEFMDFITVNFVLMFFCFIIDMFFMQ